MLNFIYYIHINSLKRLIFCVWCDSGVWLFFKRINMFIMWWWWQDNNFWLSDDLYFILLHFDDFTWFQPKLVSHFSAEPKKWATISLSSPPNDRDSNTSLAHQYLCRYFPFLLFVALKNASLLHILSICNFVSIGFSQMHCNV